MRSVGERVLQLERTVADLQTELNASRQRLVSQAAQPQVRIATIATAPTSGSDKAFGVVFNDGTFDTVPGPGSVSYTARQSAYRHVAYNLGDKQPAMGDKVLAFLSNGRWWFAVHEGSSTPVFSEPAINIFGNARVYYVTGPNAGNLVSSSGVLMWYGESIHQQHDLGAWQKQFGNDIGIVVGNAGGHSFTTTQVGTYRFTMSGKIERMYKESMSPVFPDPPRTYHFEIRCDESLSISSNFTATDAIISATLTTDANCSNTVNSNYEGETTPTLWHLSTVYGEYVAKTLLPNTAWRFRGTITYDTANEAIDFGVRFSPMLIVEKLD